VGGLTACAYPATLEHAMRKYVKWVLIVMGSAAALFVIACILMPDVGRFFLLQADSIQHAGTWEDDPKNWYRAFNEEQPGEIKVVHSKYWRSNHFTYEYECFFEVQATPEWRDAFLKKRNAQLISPPSAASYRANNNDPLTPDWFAPEPVEKHEVWDKPGYHGSIWIDKTNGHIFFYDQQL